MIKLKNLCTGLTLSGLAVLSLGTQADAYSLSFLGSTNAPNNETNYRFGFSAAAGEIISAGQQLVVSGFDGISSLSFDTPVGGAGTLFADATFNIAGISNRNTTATFTTKANISDVTGLVRYQTFVVTAMDVPTDEVNVIFNSNNIGPVAVPEPLTVLGALTAAGFGAAFKRRSLKSVD